MAGAVDYAQRVTKRLRLSMLLIAASTAACDKAPPPSVPETTAPAPPPAVITDIKVQDFDPAAAGENQIQAVYPAGAKLNPLAVTWCDALWTLPATRRAQCCGGRASGVQSHVRCAETLSTALADGAATLDAAAVQSCVDARRAQLEGCDWVGNLRPGTPAACEGLLTGTRANDESCRSSSECVAGLRCMGAGPTAAGKCATPGAPGVACNTGVDALAAATLQAGRPETECQGYCAMNRCRDAVKVGGACTISLECGAGAHCDGEKCVAGRAAVGASCASGGCVSGAQCLGSKCVEPSRDGPCAMDLECLGACVDGQCGQRCERVIAR